MRILTICPTKNRFEECSKMVKSFNLTKTAENTLVLGIDIGDAQMSLYRQIMEHKVAVKNNSTVTQIINDIYNLYPDYDFYHITNDDVIYRTVGWDSKMATILEDYGGGIAYGNDLLQGENLPTFPFISANVAKAIGWLQYPELNRYAGDVVWKHIGKWADCLYYLGNIIIEHRHNGVFDVDTNKNDMGVFASWLVKRSQDDIRKVKETIDGKC